MEYIFTLDKIIPNAARLHAAKKAFIYLNQSITYGELEKKTNQLAHYFLENGLSKGERVGILLPRNLEIPIAIYGALKAGGVFVPLDVNMPQSRLIHIIEDCKISFIVTGKFSRKKIDSLCEVVSHDIHTIGLEGQEPQAICKNAEWSEIYNSDKDFMPDTNIQAGDLAYIMYTSGTTGNPKGIMHTHKSGLSYATLSQQQYEVDSKDIVANHSPLHFDISTFGYLTAPLASATTVIISEAHTKFPVSLAQLIKKERISIWYSVPVALIQLTDTPILDSLGIDTIRWVMYGGEPYPTKQLKKLMSLWPTAQYSNVYGPAEVNQCTYYTIPKDIDEKSSVPIGQVWQDTEMLILDDNDQAVKNGEIGKLLIHSTTMMNGYWNNEELTQQAFYHHQNDEKKNLFKKYYRTGDLVRINERGLLEFQGREDRQIKTRGYRVELNEVESILLNIPDIANAAVYPYNHPDFGKLIGANVISAPESQLDKQKIQNILAESLPKYCVPEKINFVDTIQRTSAGKVDYKLLTLENNEL